MYILGALGLFIMVDSKKLEHGGTVDSKKLEHGRTVDSEKLEHACRMIYAGDPSFFGLGLGAVMFQVLLSIPSLGP